MIGYIWSAERDVRTSLNTGPPHPEKHATLRGIQSKHTTENKMENRHLAETEMWARPLHTESQLKCLLSTAPAHRNRHMVNRPYSDLALTSLANRGFIDVFYYMQPTAELSAGSYIPKDYRLDFDATHCNLVGFSIIPFQPPFMNSIKCLKITKCTQRIK